MAKKNINARTNETLEDASGEARIYELGFHLDPELPTEEVKKEYKSIRDMVAGKGTIVAEAEPQKIQLAYTISSRQDHSGGADRRDFDSAYFSWIAYETSAENHSEVLASANTNNRIIRFIDLVTTKGAVRHSAEMREIFVKTNERVEEPEEVVSTDLDVALENVVV